MKEKTITVRNFREQAHVQRYNSLMEQMRRKTRERDNAAYSEYIIFVGALAAVAEDATIEALKYFVPNNKEKKAIMALPKPQRKSYIKEHWPYYQNELKQIMKSLDVSFFENTAVKSADKLDRDILQGVMDSAIEKLSRHIYILRQAVKRAMGRVKDKNGQHMSMMEEKSYLYVAMMLWTRVCACHDLRAKMGPTPVGEDKNDEVNSYIAEWIRKNHELTSEGKPTLPSRYYSVNFETAIKPFRPTRIHDMMVKLCERIIGWWADTKDPMNKDIVKCDKIIMQKAMSMNFIEGVTRSGIQDINKYKEEVAWVDKYEDDTGDNIPLSSPMLNCITVRIAGKTSTDHILEWLLRSNSNVGPNMFMDIKRVLLWLDTKLPPAVEPDRPLTDDEKFMKVVELMYAADRPADLAPEIEKLGDERLMKAWEDSLIETNEHFAKKREEELKEKQQAAAYEAMTQTPKDIELEIQEPEQRIRRGRWKEEDARWMFRQLEKGIMTPDEAAERLGRTTRAIYDKMHRMRQARLRASTSVKPLKMLKS